MEDSSHELIDQLIAEEKYCYGFENNDNNNNNGVAIVEEETKGEKRVSSVSSQALLSHNKRWSIEEDELLIQYVKQFGYGRWKAISEKIKSRNALQCKNRARQKPELLQYIRKTPDMFELELTPPDNVLLEKEPDNILSERGEPENVLSEKNSNNEEMVQDTKEQEIILELDKITDDERENNLEWFMGKPAKTPERYMRIRNHIINCWNITRPNYLTKTAGRKNLKDCGDVNAVGRIHAYLENIGAINVNCSVPNKKTWKRSLTESESSRKKLKKGPGYYWADVDSEDDEHDSHPRKNIIVGDGKSRPKRATKRRESFYDENRIDYGMSDDPFRLIPVGYYPKQSFAPFTVEITSDALLVMEFHSHLAYTEIIGLLGGNVIDEEDGKKTLKVEYVFPCRSTSTGIQCEMDPVSEMAARELFEQKGLQVVGWYHSHPTFDPEPSIRDIENQSSYQDLFRDEASGIEPFIGIIITPYNSGNVSDRSQFQFIHISNRWNTNNHHRLPFACIQKVTQCQKVSSDMLQIFRDLLTQYKSYEHKIDMKLTYGSMTRLEKLLRSLKNHLFMDTEENKQFLIQVNQMIQEIYIGEHVPTFFDIKKSSNDDSITMDKVVDSLAI